MKNRFLEIIPLYLLAYCLLLAGCNAADTADSGSQAEIQSTASVQENEATAQELTEGDEDVSAYLNTQLNNENAKSERKETMLQMKIGNTDISVDWEENDSVEALKDLCEDSPLMIQLSMYGGFEQVGPIGQSLPRDDSQTTTQAGDIVLYSGNQIVVFYGSNSWAYTRLGHIRDKSAQEMAELLGSGDVTITIARG